MVPDESDGFSARHYGATAYRLRLGVALLIAAISDRDANDGFARQPPYVDAARARTLAQKADRVGNGRDMIAGQRVSPLVARGRAAAIRTASQPDDLAPAADGRARAAEAR